MAENPGTFRGLASQAPVGDTPGMLVRRIVSAPMWFVATLMLYELVIYVTGGPHELGPILGITAAILVAVDPLHRIWPTSRKQGRGLPSFERRETLPSATQPS